MWLSHKRGESPDTRQEGWSRAVERLARRLAAGMPVGGCGRDRCSRARISETGPADQATNEHAQVEDSVNRAQVEEGRESTHGRTEIEGELAQGGQGLG